MFARALRTPLSAVETYPMRKQIMLPAVLALTASLAACSTAPNLKLEQARTQFNALLEDPKASQLAPLETKDAGEYLLRADTAYQDSRSREKVDQLAYLTERRVDLARQTIALKEAETQLQGAAAERAKARLDARDAQISRLQESLKAKPSPRGTVVTFGDVLFQTGRADLAPSANHDVNRLAAFLRDNPKRQLIVEGYTDSTGSDATNQALSLSRAESVKRALIRQGVDAGRIATNGYGKDFPIADNGNASSRAMNRRVEVTVSNNAEAVAPRR